MKRIFIITCLHLIIYQSFAQNLSYQPADSLVDRIIVEKWDFDFGKIKKLNEDGMYWTQFESNDKKFDSISFDDLDENFNLFCSKMLEISKLKNLDSISLRKCLNLIKKKEEKIALLPIGAYFVKNGKKNTWVIVCKWEYKNATRFFNKSPERIQVFYSHIRSYAITTDEIKIIDFTSCK